MYRNISITDETIDNKTFIKLGKELKKVGKDNTEIDSLIDIAKNNLGLQYARKAHIESRAGFGLTLWGLISSVFFLGGGKTSNIPVFMLIITVIFMILSIICFLYCVWSSEYSSPVLDMLEDFNQAVQDKSQFLVNEWYLTNKCIEINEKVIKNKSTLLNWGIVFSGIYGLFVFLGFIWR